MKVILLRVGAGNGENVLQANLDRQGESTPRKNESRLPDHERDPTRNRAARAYTIHNSR